MFIILDVEKDSFQSFNYLFNYFFCQVTFNGTVRLRSLVVRALDRYSMDPSSSPGGMHVFHTNSIVTDTFTLL